MSSNHCSMSCDVCDVVMIALMSLPPAPASGRRGNVEMMSSSIVAEAASADASRDPSLSRDLSADDSALHG